jgi:phosphate-selective porin OprO and OprP
VNHLAWVSLLCCVTLLVEVPLVAQDNQAPSTNQQSGTGHTSNLDDTLDAGEAGAEEPARRLVHWNEFDGKYFSIRVGGGFLYEFDAFAQDDESKKQFAMSPEDKVRDMRILLKGQLKFIKSRRVTYSMGIMYDAQNEEWAARQTGLMIEVPEIWGHLWIGRTKEGFSMNRSWWGTASGRWSASL